MFSFVRVFFERGKKMQSNIALLGLSTINYFWYFSKIGHLVNIDVAAQKHSLFEAAISVT